MDESKRELNSLFRDLYGVPLSWAVTIGGWDNPLGEHWRKRIKDFNSLMSGETTIPSAKDINEKHNFDLDE
jgi:hypothetical protein